MTTLTGAAQPSPLVHVLRALPTMLRVALAEMVAYRAEIVIWFLTASVPLIMLLVWDRVSEDGPVGRFDQDGLATYFTVNLVVRQLSGSWLVWELNQLIRTGGLSQALLKPMHPLVFLGSESVAEKPIRAVILVPLVLFLWACWPGMRLEGGLAGVALGALSIFLAWLINTLVQVTCACVAFWLEQSMGLYMVWYGLWALFSGYVFPLDLLPHWAQAVCRVLPFQATLATPVEVITGGVQGVAALQAIAIQVLWATVFLVTARALWRDGIGRYEAYGA